MLVPVAFVAFVVAVIRSVRRREKHYRIAARADYEHAALERGELALWIYGQYPPEDLKR